MGKHDVYHYGKGSAMGETILPEKENLRRAIRWITEKDKPTLQLIEEASVRFDLSPADSAFLIRHFLQQTES
jgi:hypothetical protein